MTVYGPGAFHERVGHHRTDQRIALPPEPSCEMRGCMRPVTNVRFRKCPRELRQRRAGHGTLGITHGCFDLTTVADDGAVCEQRIDIAGSHCRDTVWLESVKRPPKPGAAPEHRLPGQSALEYGQRQGLEQARRVSGGRAHSIGTALRFAHGTLVADPSRAVFGSSEDATEAFDVLQTQHIRGKLVLNVPPET